MLYDKNLAIKRGLNILPPDSDVTGATHSQGYHSKVRHGPVALSVLCAQHDLRLMALPLVFSIAPASQ